MLLCAEALWLAMPITEFLVTIYAAIRILQKCEEGSKEPSFPL